jgi:uncharacterized protein (TIGR02145 family)
MLRSTLFISLMFGSLISFGQDINVTFTGIGAASVIDSVKATNLRTNQSLTMPGRETLVLSVQAGVNDLPGFTNSIRVYPNPFPGTAVFSAMVQHPQTVHLSARNIMGQIVAKTDEFIQHGYQEFNLSVSMAGIYLISMSSDSGTSSCKVLCTNGSGSGNSIKYKGSGLNNADGIFQAGLKNGQAVYRLDFTVGDVVHYRCKSGIYTTVVTDSPISSKNYEVEFLACTDPDGRNYSVVKIGNQTWMEENLAYLPSVSPSEPGSYADKYYYVYGYQGSSISEAKATDNYKQYGALYNWPATMDGSLTSTSVPSGIKGICPVNWHLPSDDEWKIMEKYLGMTQEDADAWYMRFSGLVGTKLKSASGWNGTVKGTNITGFNGLPGGGRFENGTFSSLPYYGHFWSATTYNDSYAWGRQLDFDREGVGHFHWLKTDGLQVRCVSDNSGNITNVFTDDRDGHVYKYVVIGSQTWMAENLAYLPSVSPSNVDDNHAPYYYVYGYQGSSVDEAKLTDNFKTYGVLYNWSAAMESAQSSELIPSGVRGACPAGWHLPSDGEWKILEMSQGMTQEDADRRELRRTGSVGVKLKEEGNAHWAVSSDTTNRGTNSSGFTALPGGVRQANHRFWSLGEDAYFWTATDLDDVSSKDRNLYYAHVGVFRGNPYNEEGYSVRCVKDN